MPGVTTTTSSTSSSGPTPVPNYTIFEVGSMIMGGIVAGIFLINAVLDFLEKIRNKNKSQEEKDKERDAPLEGRIRNLEESSRTFRSSEWLDREFNRLEEKIGHEKANRQTVTDGLNNAIRGVSASQADMERNFTRLQTQMEGMASNAIRVESAVERVYERLDERFDRIHELLSNRKD